MGIEFRKETFRDDFTFRNSEKAIRRFPFPFDKDAYMYAVNIEPHTAGPEGSVYEHPIEAPPEGSADPVRELTQRCTDVLEMYVRRHPELWLWMHRRWRDEGRGAAGEGNGADSPASTTDAAPVLPPFDPDVDGRA